MIGDTDPGFDLYSPRNVFAPQVTPPTGTGVRAYALAVVVTMLSIAVTRLTWPLFAGTPFVPLFGAVVVTTHWGTAPAGLVAVLLTVLAAPLAFPPGGPSPWEAHALVTFVAAALLANRVVSGRNRTEAALRASEAELRATWEHASLGAALLDRQGAVVRINPALERLLGYSREACVGMPFSAFSHPDEAAAERQRFVDRIAGAGTIDQRDQRYRRQDGSELWGRVTVSVIRGADGTPTGGLAVVEDVTAQRQAESDLRASEATLRQAQKMEAVGRLAAGVAHNFNNLLTIIMGFSELALSRVQDEADIATHLREITKAGERASHLTRQLLAFGRKHDSVSVPIDLNRAVADLQGMLTSVLREDIRLTIDVGPIPAVILLDEYDLEQLILNLVFNARDALPAGGAILIDVAREAIGAMDGPPGVSAAAGEYARLRVRDNGVGMTPEAEAHLFEPFFTTKEVGKGTGLGLAFVHGIVRDGRGFITIETAPGNGTTVSVHLPLAPGAAAETRVDATAAIGQERQGVTILLVEDEGAVRTVTAGMLRRAGYRVLPAATPGEACAIFTEHAGEIDLLLTDIVMPDMLGPELALRLLAQRPELRVLFISGYSDSKPAGAMAMGQAAFLAKPFTSSRLVETVTELISAHQS